jgi:hypothetical protein
MSGVTATALVTAAAGCWTGATAVAKSFSGTGFSPMSTGSAATSVVPPA